MTQRPADPAADRVLAQAQHAADCDFLNAVLSGAVHLLDPALGDRLDDVLTRHGAGGPIYDLAIKAMGAYGDAALAAVNEVLAQMVIDAARTGMLGDLRDDFKADPDSE